MVMDSRRVLDILGETGAILSGHFVFTSWRHSDRYINKDAIYPHVTETAQLCYELAKRFTTEEIGVVTGPAYGGIILAQRVVDGLIELGHHPLAVFAEKDQNGNFFYSRGYDLLLQGKPTLIVDDILTTGGSLQKVVEVTRNNGAEVIGVGVLCNRGGFPFRELGHIKKFHALAELNMPSWPAEDCRLCQLGVPINTNVGKGREFLNRQLRS